MTHNINMENLVLLQHFVPGRVRRPEMDKRVLDAVTGDLGIWWRFPGVRTWSGVLCALHSQGRVGCQWERTRFECTG